MKLSLSKSLFTKNPYFSNKNDNYNLSLLYKVESQDSNPEWICSKRNYTNLTYKYYDSNFTVSSYLKFAGFLLNTQSTFDVNNFQTLNVDLTHLKEFYLLLLENNQSDVFSFKDSFSCFKVNLESGNQVNSPLPLEDIKFVEDDDAEFKYRNLFFINVSVILFSKLAFNTEDDLRNLQNGPLKMDELPNEVKSSLVESLKLKLAGLGSEEFESNFSVTFSEPFEPVKDKLSEFYLDYTLGFGFDSRDRKHSLVVIGEYEDSPLCLRLLFQNSVALSLDKLNKEDNGKDDEDLEEEELELDGEDNENNLKKFVLKDTTVQLHRLCTFLENEPSSLFCYLTSDVNQEDASFFNPSPPEVSTPVSKVSRPNTNKGKKTSSKGKGSKSNQKNTQSSKKNVVKVKNPVFNFLPLLELFGTNLSVKIDTTTGGLSLSLNKDNKGKNEEKEDKRTNVNLVFKYLMSSFDNTKQQYVSCGGAVVPYFNYLFDSKDFVDGILEDYKESLRLKFVYNPYDVVDRSVLVSPHRAGNPNPPWLSPKKSKVYTVEGNYQYYHYTQLGVNDTGWGCCYRSLQTVCSWYLLEYHTPKPVPTHSYIQQVLKENDLSHKDLKIGSSTWIGTVESGYFLNWYLGYTYKTLYLNDVTEFRNYNVVLSEHFSNEGTPVIVGAGAYAYVILGICLESEQGEVAYLIADPHYTGDDSIKNVLNKGGIGWKKVDFLSKASEGKFINLCLPQLEKYSA